METANTTPTRTIAGTNNATIPPTTTTLMTTTTTTTSSSTPKSTTTTKSSTTTPKSSHKKLPRSATNIMAANDHHHHHLKRPPSNGTPTRKEATVRPSHVNTNNKSATKATATAAIATTTATATATTVTTNQDDNNSNANDVDNDDAVIDNDNRPTHDSTTKPPPTSTLSSTAAGRTSTTGGSTVRVNGNPAAGGSKQKTYIQLVEEAINSLKEYRTGSSLASIKKYIISNYPHLYDISQNNYFNARINVALKTGCNAKPVPRFQKVKVSYRIAPEYKNLISNQKRQQKRKSMVVATTAVRGKSTPPLSSSSLSLQHHHHHRTDQLGSGHNNDNGKNNNNNDNVRQLSHEEQRVLEERRQKREEAKRIKAAEEARLKQIMERIRRRKFPMEDTKLHTEDKLYNVKPPSHVTTRPYLPYFWYTTIPLHHPNRYGGKTNSTILNASKVDTLDIHDTRGIVPDLLHIYHFFMGDIHFLSSSSDHPATNGSNANGNSSSIVPNHIHFKHLIYAGEQMLNGTMKRTKCVPPLIVHLFVTCLQLLLTQQQHTKTTNENDATHTTNKDNNELSKEEKQLRQDLNQYLYPALSASSWADITYLYMDAMQRFYTTDSSYNPNSLQPLFTDVNYLFGRTEQPTLSAAFMSSPPPKQPKSTRSDDTVDDNDPGTDTTYPQQHLLPDGYVGYLGDEHCCLHRAHTKLARQDPWLLTAEEIFALLRALTEDVLASHPAAAKDIEQRDDQMTELLKNKRSADMKLRKVRLAYEGPKKPAATKPKTENDTTHKDDDDEDNKNGNQKAETAEIGNGKENGETKVKPFVPTATKKQYEAALKAQEKANDAYEKGIRKFVARTEPVGYDRNYNAVYCFLHDPDVLYIEEKKPPTNLVTFPTSSNVTIPYDMQFPRSSWHVIESTSLCDRYASSLDIRGRREHDLYEVLMGPPGHTNQSLYRYLYDDIKIMSDAKSKIREKESLLEKLKIAQIKCDEEKGRRSGRLAGQAEIELFQIQSEIEELERTMEKNKSNAKDDQHVALDYKEVTGFNALVQFETSGGNSDTRRATRDKKLQAASTATSTSMKLTILNCSKLYPTGHIDGTGFVGMLVSSLLDLEERCNSLAQWDRTDITRANWINKLENAVSMWHSICPDMFGSLTSEPSSNNRIVSMNADSALDTSSRSELKRSSMESDNGFPSTKRSRKTDSPSTLSMASSVVSLPSVSTILSVLKQTLLDLEERVADITNVALATKDADLADDNMSTTDDDDDKISRERMELEWKRLIHKLRSIPARRNTKIRKTLVDAITAARKAHLQQVVTELRDALLLYRPSAPHECKMAAIEVLVLHGDYDATNDVNAIEDGNDENESNEAENVDIGDEPAIEDAVPSVLSAEAAILRSSLGGSDDARREDWVGMVKSARTLSRLASLTTAFISDAMEKIVKVESERDELVNALQIWGKAEERQSKQRDAVSTKAKSSSPREIMRPSEVWANVRYTDEICMAKTDEYPWWPAKMCDAKDPDIAKSLKQVKRSLVAFVGEMGSLRVIKTSCIKPFTGKVVDEKNMDEYTKDIRAQLEDCMTMARRIQRGLCNMKIVDKATPVQNNRK